MLWELFPPTFPTPTADHFPSLVHRRKKKIGKEKILDKYLSYVQDT